MSGKTGKRLTGRKPDTVRRRGAKTDGAFGKETAEQIVEGAEEQNVDKGARKIRTGGASGE
jgi:hypothetical protein